MRDVLVLIYSTLLGRQPGTNSNTYYGNESVHLWALSRGSDVSRYLRIGACMTSYANELVRLTVLGPSAQLPAAYSNMGIEYARIATCLTSLIGDRPSDYTRAVSATSNPYPPIWSSDSPHHSSDVIGTGRVLASPKVGADVTYQMWPER